MRNSHAKKFSLLVICLMLLALMLSACYVKTDAEGNSAFETTESRLIQVDRGDVIGGYFLILKDVETGVHYLYIHSGSGYELSVLYNSDGTPYIGAKMDGGAEDD